MKKIITIFMSFLVAQGSFVFASAPEIQTNALGKNTIKRLNFKEARLTSLFTI